jgi:hypothetical protein
MPLHLFCIDDELRAVLHELESHFNIKFDDTVVDKIFADAEAYSLNQGRQYTLYQSSSNWFAWFIEGIVEEHEPETIWLQSRFGFRKQEQFEAFFKNRT